MQLAIRLVNYALFPMTNVYSSRNSNLQVLQRVYKFGGQPFVRDYLALKHSALFENAFGKGTGKAIMHATAGT